MYLKEHKEPWKKTLLGIRGRISKRMGLYYRKGIKCRITAKELKRLWFRDKAYLMKKPTIDRKDNNKNYTFQNCQYIEHRLNCSKRNLTPKMKRNWSKKQKINWKDVVYRKKMSEIAKNNWKDPNFRRMKSLHNKKIAKENWNNPICRKKMLKNIQNNWKNPTYIKLMKKTMNKIKRKNGKFYK